MGWYVLPSNLPSIMTVGLLPITRPIRARMVCLVEQATGQSALGTQQQKASERLEGTPHGIEPSARPWGVKQLLASMTPV